jgi:predicted dehydrogenase
MTISRRTFLKTASIATAGIVAMPARSYARILGANDRVNVGIVGFSDRARHALIPGLMDYSREQNFDITGISDIWNLRRDEGRLFMQEKYQKDVKIWRNNDELYADPDVDAVIISTADFQHALHTIEAADAKKHAFVEKPFAETMQDNRAAMKAVKDSGIVVQIGSQRRSGRNYHAAHDYIASGRFGDITMVEMSWNVNQPGRWRRPSLVAGLKESDVDWQRYILNRPPETFDARKYVEYRLFWPYSSGIPGQWMSHQIDTVHWFSGHMYPRSVTANGGIYKWNDGRTNFDTMTAVFEYGPANDPDRGFQVVYTSRMHNAAGGVKEIYYSNGGELNLDTNMVSPNGGLEEEHAKAMGMEANRLDEFRLTEAEQVVTSANTSVDEATSLHILNWMECVRTGKTPNASVEAGYYHSVANIMVTAALRSRKFVTFDPNTHEVMAGGDVFHY